MNPLIWSRVGQPEIIVPVPLTEDQCIVLAICFVLVSNARARGFACFAAGANVQVSSALWLLTYHTARGILKFAPWAAMT